jgi:SH3-like domain-containing protein
MKKLFFLLGLIGLTVLSLSKTDILIVKVQSTALRPEPNFFSAVKLMLKAGDQLEKLASREGWFQVRLSSGTVGWVHSSAVQPRPSQLMALAQGPKTQATMSEVALASKGFNRQVEASYRQKHPEIDYSWVDRMLGFKASLEAVETFLREGQLGEWKEAK